MTTSGANELNILRISRLLPPTKKADLLNWVNLAFAAESSVKKSFGVGITANSTLHMQPQENSCKNILRRSKK